MSNRFTDLFGGFENERLQEAFADCEIKNVKISMEKKSIFIDAFFPCLFLYHQELLVDK